MLAQAFNASLKEVQWVVLAYLLAITTLAVSVGRLGDLAGELVPREETGRAMGLLGTMSAIGTALGPPLGGGLS